jgi:uracil-DNA glycosylase
MYSKHLPSAWATALADEVKKDYFVAMENKLTLENNSTVILPSVTNVFAALELTSPADVKVVILGQDPYIKASQAMGLSFSVPTGEPIPPSLKNIFKELSTDIKDFKTPDSGDLTSWTKQGVLLLNSTLTVQMGTSNSHKKYGWQTFTDAVLKYIDVNCKNVVFILWGNDAKSKSKFIDSSKHLVLNGVHPSPLSASRGFFGGQYFSKTNDYLKANNKSEIKW